MDNKLISSRQYGFIKGRSTSDLPTLVNCHAVIPGPFPVPVHSPTYPSLRFIPFTPLLPFLSPHPFPLSITLPIIPLPHSTNPARESGERCKKLPQRVRAEPGRQTHFGAAEANNWALACGAGLTALQNE